MAINSTDNILCELAKLVGVETICVRKTDESPPRVSVIDVAVVVTGHNAHYVSDTVRNIRKKFPDIHDKIGDVFLDARGRKGGKNTPVTNVGGIVDIIMQLPGEQAGRVRRQAAELLVRYLGGDLTIVKEIIDNRAFQNQLADEEPKDPRRIFGGAVEATSDPAQAMPELVQSLLSVLKNHLTETVRYEMQRTHPWDFQKRGNSHNLLLYLGKIVEGQDLIELDYDEHVVRIVDFLRHQIPSDEWKWHGNKLKSIFSVELKKQAIEKRISDERPLYIAQNQGEYRIIYTEADHEFMMDVFHKCKKRIGGLLTRDEAFLKSSRKQRRIQDYFTRGVSATCSSLTSGMRSPDDRVLPSSPRFATGRTSAGLAEAKPKKSYEWSDGDSR